MVLGDSQRKYFENHLEKYHILTLDSSGDMIEDLFPKYGNVLPCFKKPFRKVGLNLTLLNLKCEFILILGKYFSQNYMEPFLKWKLTMSRQLYMVSVDADLLCCCSTPDVRVLGLWIAFENCDQWYLKRHAGIKRKQNIKESAIHM